MSEEELTEIIENSKNAKLIHEFFNKTISEINPFDKELDFEDLNTFVDSDIKAVMGINSEAQAAATKSKLKKKAVKQSTSSNSKTITKKSSSKRL